MNVLQCYEQLYNYVHEYEDGHAYSADEIDIDQIWNVILSSAEVSMNSLIGFRNLLDLYHSECGIQTTEIPSITSAVKKFSNSSISAKERFKSAPGMFGFMSFFPPEQIIIVIRSFVDILTQLVRYSETIPFKSLATFSIVGQMDIDVLYEIFIMAKSAKENEQPAYALIMSLLYNHYTDICDESTNPSIDDFLYFMDELIYNGLKNGNDITKACVSYLAESIALSTEDDPYILMEEFFEPSLALATHPDLILARQGHRLMCELFNHMMCTDIDHIYQFLGTKEKFKHLHFFYKELRYLCLSSEHDPRQEDNFEFQMPEIVQKKIIKFLKRAISDEKLSDLERSEALGTIAELGLAGVDSNLLFNEDQLKVCEELLQKEPNPNDPVNLSTLSHFLVLPASIPNRAAHNVVKKLIPVLFEKIKNPTKPKYSGLVGLSLAEIVVFDDFEEFRDQVLALIQTLFQSTCNYNIDYAAQMITTLYQKLNEYSAGKIYKSAIQAVESCDDVDVVNDSFKSLKKLMKHFALEEDISNEFVQKLIKGQIASLSNIPLIYCSDENVPMFKFIASFVDRFPTKAKSISQTFVNMLSTAYDDMKYSIFIPINAILKQKGCSQQQAQVIKKICFTCFEKLGYTYSDTLSQAAFAISYIREQFPDLIGLERMIGLMQEVLSNYDENEEDEKDEIDENQFTGISAFMKICLDFLNDSEIEDKSSIDEIFPMLIEKIGLEEKATFIDEISNKVAAYLDHNMDCELATTFGEFLVRILMKPKIAEDVGVSEKTMKKISTVILKYRQYEPSFENEMLEKLGSTHGLKRKIKFILGTLFCSKK